MAAKPLNCPGCQETLGHDTRRCPNCGARVMRMESGVLKTSTVLIASDEMHAVFPSLRDVPEPMRRRVIESTTGRNSGTILIADRRGKLELERAARYERVANPAEPPDDDTNSAWRRWWPAIVALAVSGAGAALAFLVHW